VKGGKGPENQIPAVVRSLFIKDKAVLRIRNKSFGSGSGSRSGWEKVSDLDPDSNPDSNPESNPDSNPESHPDSNPGFESRSGPETGQHFFLLKILTQLLV